MALWGRFYLGHFYLGSFYIDNLMATVNCIQTTIIQLETMRRLCHRMLYAELLR